MKRRLMIVIVVTFILTYLPYWFGRLICLITGNTNEQPLFFLWAIGLGAYGALLILFGFCKWLFFYIKDGIS